MEYFPIKKEIKEEMEIEIEEGYIERDALLLLKNMQHRHNIINHKKLFLMGLTSRESLHQNMHNQSSLPELFLRKDDLFYDNAKNLVERCFGGCNVNNEQCMFPDDVLALDLPNMARNILTMLDDFSNNGLYNLAKLLTGGLMTSVKTRPQMKRVIKSSLLAVQSNRYPSDSPVRLQNELCQLLKSPKNFQENCKKHVKLTLKSHRDDIMKLLDELKPLKFQTLMAMRRKLTGIQGKRPQLHPRVVPCSKEGLIKGVRELSLSMIQRLGESDELPQPLVKAMAVAGLSLYLVSRSQDRSVFKFLHVTPEKKTLIDEIVTAILLLDQRIKKEEMMKLRHLLDPDSKADGKTLKSAIRNMLVEFLFECIDMDVVPDSILDVLSLINKRLTYSPSRSLSKDLMNEDLDCILNVSAYLKQLLWESDPSGQLDLDFVDAYMDESEESDDGDIFDDIDNDQKLHANSMDEANDFSEEVGSTSYRDDAESSLKDANDGASSKLVDSVCSDTVTSPVETPIFGTAKNGSSPLISSGFTQVNLKSTSDIFNTDGDSSKLNVMPENQKNSYVAIQEVCDNTSIVSFQLIGHLLSEFGQLEALGLDQNEESYLRGDNSRAGNYQDPVANLGDKDVSGSIFIEAVQKILPSFSNGNDEKNQEGIVGGRSNISNEKHAFCRFGKFQKIIYLQHDEDVRIWCHCTEFQEYDNSRLDGGLTLFAFGVYFYTMRAGESTDEIQAAINKFEDKKWQDEAEEQKQTLLKSN